MNCKNLSVNYHLTDHCNMRCRYCFAHFERQTGRYCGVLEREKALRVARQLGESFGKITFVGGEPTLVRFLPELVAEAKAGGAATMVVTNGSLLSPSMLKQLAPHLDWVGMSMDSADPAIHALLGRRYKGQPLPPQVYVSIADQAHRMGLRVKVNTVVTALNHQETMAGLIARMRVERWKVLRVIGIRGQNEAEFSSLEVTDAQFQGYVQRNRLFAGQPLPLVYEDGQDMVGTYLMVDPQGRFFDNVDGELCYGRSLLDLGVEQAMSDVRFDAERFIARGAEYDWSRSAESERERLTTTPDTRQLRTSHRR